MIISCGETWAQRKKRLQDWHPFFALWPRQIAEVNGVRVCAWLQVIGRKGMCIDGWDDTLWIWEYRVQP